MLPHPRHENNMTKAQGLNMLLLSKYNDLSLNVVARIQCNYISSHHTLDNMLIVVIQLPTF